jgi:hypothetical protein
VPVTCWRDGQGIEVMAPKPGVTAGPMTLPILVVDEAARAVPGEFTGDVRRAEVGEPAGHRDRLVLALLAAVTCWRDGQGIEVMAPKPGVTAGPMTLPILGGFVIHVSWCPRSS